MHRTGKDRRPSGRSLAAVGPVVLAVVLAAALALAAAGAARAQDISVDPSISAPQEPEFTVALAIGTGGQQIVGLEVEIGFDPTLVELHGVDAGTWVTGSGLEYFFWDHTEPGADTIHLTMAFLGASRTGSGQLAVCRFAALAVGVCPLEFLSLDVRGPDNVDLGFTHSEGDKIVIDAAIGAEEVTLGRVKALYR